MQQKKQHKQLLTSLQQISFQIKNSFLSRKKVFEQSIAHAQNLKPEVSESYSREIVGYCAQYEQIKRFVQEVCQESNQYLRSATDQGAKFWEVNEKTERELQKKLKQLKQIDSFIDEMISEEMNLANEVEETEELIRTILVKKDNDHIEKAEPYYLRKQSCLEKLASIKTRKESAKEQKLRQLKQILEILYTMKNLRGNRLRECNNASSNKQSVNIMHSLSQDLEQVIKNQSLYRDYQSREGRLFQALFEGNQKASKLISNLLEMFDSQMSALQEIDEIFVAKSEISFFNERLINFFGVGQNKLLGLSEVFSKYIEQEKEKADEKKQIEQGIITTEETIEIFENLSENIESENRRKRQLMLKINDLSRFREDESKRRQSIGEKEANIASLRQNCSKLEKMLEAKAEEADVKGYRTVHSEMDKYEKQLKRQYTDLERLKSLKRQAAKKIYYETNEIQDEYRDLLSEILPHIWFRDHDFSKEQTISDLDMYLGKLFSRLKILS